MLKRDKQQYGMIAFSFFAPIFAITVAARSNRFPRTEKSPRNQESPHQGVLKKRGCRKPIRVIKKKSNN